MLKKIFSLLIFLAIGTMVYAQTVKVINAKSGLEIQNVSVFDSNKKFNRQTDQNGQINLSEFSTDAIITFRHPSFMQFSVAKSSLADGQVISLSELILEMNEVVVSANKWEQSSDEIPNSIAKIDGKSIEFQNPQTTADLLSNSGKVFVQKSQLGGGSPMIRGFSANSLLIVVDGIRMNNAIFRAGNLQNVINVDPQMIEESEVLFGPGSVIYGSDALGGVMDFHTKSGLFSDSSFWSGKVMSRYSSASNEKTAGVSLSYNSKRFNWIGNFSYTSLGDLKTGKKYDPDYPLFGQRLEYVESIDGVDQVIQNSKPWIQVGSAYHLLNFNSKFKFLIAPETTLEYATYYSTSSDIPRYDRLIEYRNGQLRYGNWYYGPQEWLRNNLSLTSTNKSGLFDESSVILAHQYFEESRHTRSFGSSNLTHRLDRVNSFHFNLDFNKELTNGNTLYYGLENNFNQVVSTARTENILTNTFSPASTRYPDGGSSQFNSAAYISWKNRINEQWISTIGFRYNITHLEAKFIDKSFYDFPYNSLLLNDNDWNGSAGIVYLPNELSKISINASSGFRSPNIDDVGKLFDSEPGFIIVPNPDLTSEKVYNLDFSIRQKLGQMAIIELTAFRSWISDLMVRRDFQFNGQDYILYEGVSSRVQALVNDDWGTLYGGNVYLNVRFNQYLSLNSSITLTKGSDSEGFNIRHAPPLFGSTSLKWAKSKWTLETYSQYNGAIAYADLAPSEQNKPHLYSPKGSVAWVTYNFRSTYQIHENWLLSAGVENITNLHYRPYSSGISAPGINGIVSLTIKF